MIIRCVLTTSTRIAKSYSVSNKPLYVLSNLLSTVQYRHDCIVNIDTRWSGSIGKAFPSTRAQVKTGLLWIVRRYSTENNDEKKQYKSILADPEPQPETQLSTARRVVKAGKDVSYLGVILIGFGITGILFWSVFRELFSSNSANNIYSHTLKLVKSNQQVIDALGTPITAHGDQSGRNRYRNISSQEYIVNNENYMRVKYYINGTRNKGTVHVDLKEVSRGNYEYRYILVELTGYQRGTIMVEDNR